MTGQINQENRILRQNALGDRRRKKVKDLHALSRRSLWEIVLFIVISIGALSMREFDLLGAVSENARVILGYPPPAFLVTIALGAYCFSALTINLTQLTNDAEPLQKWSHLGYRSVFYLFYAFSGSLASYFMAVFLIGFSLYGLEQVHIWSYCHREMPQDKGLLGEQ